MRARLGIGSVIVLTMGALMWTAPAAILERSMPEELPLRLARCQGDLLRSGKCQVFLRGSSGWLHAGAVSYAWRFTPDLGAHLALRQDSRRTGTLKPSFDGWQASGIDLQTPMMLPDVLPGNSVGAWQLSGRQATSVPALACGWRSSECTGQVRIDVIDLTVGRLSRDPVGSYRLELGFSPGGRTAGRLSTLSGPLTLDASIERSPSPGMRITGRARLAAGVNDEIRQLLANLARREDADTFAFSFP